MQVELYKEDISFIADVLRWAPLKPIMRKLEENTLSPECDEFVYCELTKEELDELVGYLSLEANHNKKRKVTDRTCDIADYLEVQIR